VPIHCRVDSLLPNTLLLASWEVSGVSMYVCPHGIPLGWYLQRRGGRCINTSLEVSLSQVNAHRNNSLGTVVERVRVMGKFMVGVVRQTGGWCIG